MKLQTVYVMLSGLVLAACGGGGGSTITPTPAAPVIPQTIFTSTNNCSSEYTPSSVLGNFLVWNVIWNPGVTQGYSVCNTASVDSSQPAHVVTSAVFNWKFASTTLDVKAYPSVAYGWHPGSSSGLPAALPQPANKMPDLVARGKSTTTCKDACIYSTSFDIFLQDTATPTTFKPTAEIMISTENSNFQNGGKFVSLISIDGTMYELYKGTVSLPPTVTNLAPHTWNYIFYKSTTPITTLNIHVKSFIADALARGYIDPYHYVETIQFGTEVVTGTGTTVLENYSIR